MMAVSEKAKPRRKPQDRTHLRKAPDGLTVMMAIRVTPAQREAAKKPGVLDAVRAMLSEFAKH